MSAVVDPTVPSPETRQPIGTRSTNSEEEKSPTCHRFNQDEIGAEVTKHSTILLDEVFSFFYSFKQVQLRNINKAWGLTVSGVKDVMVARAMLWVVLQARKGDEISDVIQRNRFIPNSDEFGDAKEKCKGSCKVYPGRKVLLQEVDAKERSKIENMFQSSSERRTIEYPVSDASRGSRKAPKRIIDIDSDVIQEETIMEPFCSLSEFARLMIILRDDQIAKSAAIQATEEELSKLDMDNGVLGILSGK